MTDYVKRVANLVAKGTTLKNALVEVSESSAFKAYGFTLEQLCRAYDLITHPSNVKAHLNVIEGNTHNDAFDAPFNSSFEPVQRREPVWAEQGKFVGKFSSRVKGV